MDTLPDRSPVEHDTPPLRLRAAVLHWVLCLALWGLPILWAVHSGWRWPDLHLVSYFVAGFYLNRRVLRRLVVWHPNFDTLKNVSSSKLGAFLFWPLSYPVLFFKMAVVKVL
jgi:hypothetical protein